MTYATDINLLHWEPNLHAEAAWASQTLFAGTGTLAGTTFTVAGGSFLSAQIKPRHVLRITAGSGGSYPIVNVDSATQLTVSALYDALFDDTGSAVAPVGGADLSFVVRTFSPQLRTVSDLLRQAAGIHPGTADADRSEILNPEALRTPCAMGALQMIYNALAAAAGDDAAHYAVRADLYERLYRRTLRAVFIELDLNNDGRADTRRQLNLLELQRR